MRGYVSIISVLIFLVLITAFVFKTGFDEDIGYVLATPVTPPGTYVAGHDFSGLDRQSVREKLDSFAEQAASGDLVFWVDEVEYYKRPLRELGFEINTSTATDEIFSCIPSGFGWANLVKRYKALQAGIAASIPFTYSEEKLRSFIEDVKSQSDRDVREPFFDFENHTIAEGLHGRRLDVNATLDEIPLTLTSIKSLSLNAVLERTEPKTDISELKGIDPTNPLASFTTKFNARKVGRSHNIGLLSSKFKGVVVKPGEQFSFNKISGPRTKEEGYREAPEYINHRIIIGYGGGSCQVSTTLYNAALLSGMKVDERTPHSRVIDYVPYGRDATVNYTSGVDFRFTNVLKHSVVVWSRSDTKAGRLTFEVFGNPEDRQNIEITNSYTRIMRDASAEQRIIDRALAPGKEVVEDKGTNGIRVRTWRHFIQPDGSRRTEELFYDVIAPVSRIVRYNPGTGSMDTSVSKTEKKKEAEKAPEVYF